MEVKAVWKGTPAEKTGMQPGDRILALNGRRIESATVINLFEQWEGSAGELGAGDLLAVFSDGVTEATRGGGRG